MHQQTTKSKKKWPALLGAAVLALASLPALAIQPFTVDYQASYMGMRANGQMSLSAAGENRWRYSLNITNSLASLSQSTVFDEHGGQWRPLSGQDSSKVLVKKTVRNAIYDWGRGVANWTGDVKEGRAGPLRLQAGDMDALLINLALVRDVVAGRPLNYRMVDDGRIKQMTYTIAGREQISVGGRNQQATKVVSTNGSKQTIAWIVDGIPVPARILQRDDGEDAMDLRVQSVR
ncbi:DUF3108 domain-containing protein [Montanilutibacter psychrotolerans]|uniref:DUF3108 domain-containing protein n=1 Tax=Montanilutibacter psychrotolerans TaxID=1327343 RepID=A0A3M8SYZ8_9GAMM|nr:DUF3108 domain-containing protein [Lysobacter psychrotolerans]RNF86053.1 DUF3108 domain-containing protein [Lysobacter psychrotolerans]